jgi:hypothetical protein
MKTQRLLLRVAVGNVGISLLVLALKAAAFWLRRAVFRCA